MQLNNVIKNQQYTRFQFGVWRHSNRQKKHRSTKEMKERQTSLKMEQAWNGLYLFATYLATYWGISTKYARPSWNSLFSRFQILPSIFFFCFDISDDGWDRTPGWRKNGHVTIGTNLKNYDLFVLNLDLSQRKRFPYPKFFMYWAV